MFDSIQVRQQNPLGASRPLNLGFLAEAMLFYQHVHLIGDINALEQLVRAVGAQTLVDLVEERFLTMTYLTQQPCIVEIQVDTSEPSLFVAPVTVADGLLDLDWIAPRLFARVDGASKRGSDLGRRFAKLVATLDTSDVEIGPDLFGAVCEDYANSDYVETAVRELLANLAPGYRLPHEFRFRILKQGAGFQVDTDIDFDEADAHRQQQTRGIGWDLSMQTVLLYLMESTCDLYFAAKDGIDLATDPARAAVISVRCNDLLQSSQRAREQIETFQEMTLDDGRSIAECITRGHRSWREYVSVLRRARKFKQWLDAKPSDAQLTREYLRAIERDTWIGSLPVKAFRFLIFSALGTMLSPLASIGLSAADTFMVDRISRGWRPNQFVNGPLRSFSSIR